MLPRSQAPPRFHGCKIKSGSGLGTRLLSVHELALSSDHMPGFKAIHTRSQCSQSLLQILRYIARKHNLCMLLCVTWHMQPWCMLLCVIWHMQPWCMLLCVCITVSVVLIHGIIILCDPLQPTETVSCKYPLLLWISWNCTTKIFRLNFSTRISTQV